jgi:hypothetical protein
MAIVVICVELDAGADLGLIRLPWQSTLTPFCGNSGLKYLHFCLDQNKPTTITTIIITSSQSPSSTISMSEQQQQSVFEVIPLKVKF